MHSKLYLLFICSLLLIAGAATARQATLSDTAYYTEIGGLKQYLRVLGDQESEKPLLLYLHGGPGQPVSQQADILTDRLQSHFVVVHWDQRESGLTLKANPSDEPLTLYRMMQDTEEVVDYLLRTYNKEKLYLVGLSWGTIPGFYMADKHPEQLSAFIAISPPIDARKSQQIALNTLKSYFAGDEEPKAMQQLQQVQVPYENLHQRIIQYRWQAVYDGEEVTEEQVQQAMPFFRQWESTWGELNREAEAIDFANEYHTLACPVYLMAGLQDYQTNHVIAKNFFRKLTAPAKDLFLFDSAGHNIPSQEPDNYQQVIIDQILERSWYTPFQALTGKWQIEGKEVYELWAFDKAEGEFAGEVYKISDGKKEVLERISLYSHEGAVVYEASVPDQNDGRAIRFVVGTEGESMMFSNPAHDFPQQIVYKPDGSERLRVTISGQGQESRSWLLLRTDD
ncbi:MAG: alpha/beta hydrolase [Cyclobacteriaceae bacterium]